MLPDKVGLIIDTFLSANRLDEQAQLIDWTHLTRGGGCPELSAFCLRAKFNNLLNYLNLYWDLGRPLKYGRIDIQQSILNIVALIEEIPELPEIKYLYLSAIRSSWLLCFNSKWRETGKGKKSEQIVCWLDLSLHSSPSTLSIGWQ